MRLEDSLVNETYTVLYVLNLSRICVLKQLSKYIMAEFFTQLPSRGTRCIFDLRARGVRFLDTAVEI